ncbi:response regulator, partial [Acinetobacter baumannii]
AAMRQSVAQFLTLSGIAIEALDSAAAALARLGGDFPGILVSDVRMPGMDGMALLNEARARDPELPVLLLTGHGDVPLAVAAMR